jgi:hypothetical protein
MIASLVHRWKKRLVAERREGPQTTAIPTRVRIAVLHLYLQAPCGARFSRPDSVVVAPILALTHVADSPIPIIVAQSVRCVVIEPPAALPHDHAPKCQATTIQAVEGGSIIESTGIDIERDRSIAMSFPPAAGLAAGHVQSRHPNGPNGIAMSDPPVEIIAIDVWPISDDHMSANRPGAEDNVRRHALPRCRCRGRNEERNQRTH